MTHPLICPGSPHGSRQVSGAMRSSEKEPQPVDRREIWNSLREAQLAARRELCRHSKRGMEWLQALGSQVHPGRVSLQASHRKGWPVLENSNFGLGVMGLSLEGIPDHGDCGQGPWLEPPVCRAAHRLCSLPPEMQSRSRGEVSPLITREGRAATFYEVEITS